MTGMIINATADSVNISLDKKIFDDTWISSILRMIETEILAKKVDFDSEILELAEEIKSAVWENEKKRF
jgi:hypothetical protein